MSALGNVFRRSWGSMRDFFRGSAKELRRVRWPTRAEMVRYTIVVLTVVTLMTLFILLNDTVITQLINLVLDR